MSIHSTKLIALSLLTFAAVLQKSTHCSGQRAGNVEHSSLLQQYTHRQLASHSGAGLTVSAERGDSVWRWPECQMKDASDSGVGLTVSAERGE